MDLFLLSLFISRGFILKGVTGSTTTRLYSVCIDSGSNRATVVGGGNDNNGRGDMVRVSTAELQPNVQCVLFLMKLARVSC